MEKIKNFLKSYTFRELVVLFIVSLTPFLWLANGYIVLGHDSGFRPEISHHLKMLRDTWNSSINTGTDWSIYKGFLLIQFPEYVLQSLFGSLEKSQPFVLSFWFFSMAVGMYIFTRLLFTEKKHWFIRLYVSLFWVFNFYILQGWFIAERAKFSLYAALPISLAIFIFVFKRTISLYIGSFLFGLLYFIFNGGGSPPLFGASFVAWGVTWIFFTYKEVLRNKFNGVIFSVFFLCLFGLSFFLLNAYWLLPQVSLITQNYSNAVSQEGGIDGLIAWEREISKHTSVFNLLRLQGIPDWYNNNAHSYSEMYLTNPVFIVASLFPSLIIFLGFIRFSLFSLKKELTIVLVSFLLLFVGLFFSSGSHPPTGNIYLLLMKYVPGFAIFRSSFYKFAPLVWFSIIFLSGYYASRFLYQLKSSKLRHLIGIVIIFCLLLYHHPFFTSDFFKFDSNFSTKLKIPDYVYQISKYINNKLTINDRILVLPALDTGYINKPIDTYTWGFYSLDVLPRLLVKVPVIANDSNLEPVKLLYDRIEKNDQKAVANLMQILGITYVLIRDDVAYSSNVSSNISTVTMFKKRFLKKEFQSGSWSVYSTNVSNIEPKIYKDIISVSGYVQNESLLATQSTVVVRDQDNNLLTNIEAIQFECFFCNNNEYEQFSSTITFPPKASRLRTIFPGKKIPPSNNPETIDNYLIEAFTLVREGNVEDYKNLLKLIISKVQLLSERDRIIYTARVLAFIKYQSSYFKENPIQEQINELEKQLWVTNEKSYKLGISLEQGSYVMRVFPNDYRVQINGKSYSDGETVSIPGSYIKAEIERVSEEKPFLFLLTNNIAVENQIFVSKQTFDRRWFIKDNGIRKQSEFMVNGYANGWNVHSNKNYELVFGPQNVSALGEIMTMASLISAVLFLLLKVRRL